MSHYESGGLCNYWCPRLEEGFTYYKLRCFKNREKYSVCIQICCLQGGSVAKWSPPWTRNWVVSGWSPTLATYWICSCSSWVQFVSSACK